MKRLILAALLISAPAFTQETRPQRSTKLVPVKYASPENMINVIRMFGVDVQMYTPGKVLSVTGLPDQIAAAEAAIRQLDLPAKNVELVAYFVVGTNQPAPAGAAPVPAEIRDVITQLKSTFPFKEYTMLDTLTLRTRAGSAAETTGILNAAPNPRLSHFSIRSATVSDDGVIRIDRMHAGLRTPVTVASKSANEPARVEYMNTGIDQDIDIKEGQKVVVGRASLEGPEKALFIVLTARVVP
jgi:hypothetical protein